MELFKYWKLDCFKIYMLKLNEHRLRVSFENISRTPIPEEYHYQFRNVLLLKVQKFDPTLSSSMHDKWDHFFTFSGFLGKQWKTPIGMVFKNVDVMFASPDSSIISALKNAFLLSPKFQMFNASVVVNSVKPDNLTLDDGVTHLPYESLGEIVIKKENEKGQTIHVGKEDDIQFNLESIIKKQYLAFSGNESKLAVEIKDFKQKKKAIVKDGVVSNSFIALRLKFNLEADRNVHEFLLTQGVGHHRKMGFGMVGILKERKE